MKLKQLLFAVIILSLLFVAGCASPEPTEEEKEAMLIETVLENMTLEEKVGQMFLGCFYGGMPEAGMVAPYNMGGVVLFSSTFDAIGPDYLKVCTDALDEASAVNPLIAVDEEGGYVVRVSSSGYYRTEPFKSPRQLYSEGGMDAIVADAHEKNQLLKDLGIDMNLAPVADITQDPASFMYDRSLGQDADITSQFITAVVEACVEDKMGCALKHFPGYGNAADTHYDIAKDTRPIEEFKQKDFLPFQAGIDAGTSSILVSHSIVTAIDPKMPASLSTEVHRILREDMGFDGVVITDDLSMGAITKFTSDTECAVLAIKAGNDMLCTGAYKTQIPAVINAVNDGTLTEKRINRSVKRILKMKLALGVVSKQELTETYVPDDIEEDK